MDEKERQKIINEIFVLRKKRDLAKEQVASYECQINILMNKVKAMQEIQEVPAGMVRVKQDVTRLNKGGTVIVRKITKKEKEKRSIII